MPCARSVLSLDEGPFRRELQACYVGIAAQSDDDWALGVPPSNRPRSRLFIESLSDSERMSRKLV